MTFDFADVKPSVVNWMTTGLMVVTFIHFWKWVFAQFEVPGLSDLFASI